MKSFKFILPLILILTFSAHAQTTYTWFGGEGDWEMASNWSPNGIPGELDTAIIDTGTVIVTEHDSIANLHLSGILDGATNLTVLNEMKWNDGELKGSGILVIDSNATAQFKPLTNWYLTSGRKFYNYGTVNWDSGSVYIAWGRAFYNYGSFVDQTTTNHFMQSTSLDGKFYNYGEFIKTGSGNTSLALYLVSNGKLDFQNDTTTFNAGVSICNDSVKIGANALVSINSGITFNGPVVGAGSMKFYANGTTIASSYNISGSTEFITGTTIFNENATIDNLGVDKIPTIRQQATVEFNTGKLIEIDSLHLAGGYLVGSDDISINNLLLWQLESVSTSEIGSPQAGSVLTIEKSAIFIIDVANKNNVFSQIDNFGTTIWNGGSLTFYNGIDFDNYGVFVDTLNYAYVWKSQPDGCTFNNFGTYIKSGYKNYIDLPFVNKPEGLLKGTGGLQLSGGYTNEGTLGPGNPIGALAIAGDFTATASSILAVELGGLIAGDEFDQLSIVGTASLGGTLDIKTQDDYLPEVGNEFQIMTFTSGSGSFNSFRGLDTGKGVAFEVTVSATDVKLVAVEATPNTPPATFSLISPADKATLETMETIEFTWQASLDEEGDSLFYALNIYDDSFDTTITHIADTTFKFISNGSLDDNTSYEWTVLVTDGISEVASPDVFSFTTPLPNGIGEQDSRMPEKFNLAQNYPNPFNPATTIQYDLPVTNYVVLKIYDLTGKEIQTLVNGTKQAGRHDVVFNSSGLASGIYLYRIEAGNNIQIKRMLLIK